MSFTQFLASVFSDKMLFITAVLTVSVIFVNGWTDAPNAIATCVSTRALKVRTAIVMAAFCNLLGVAVMTGLNSSVAQTIYNIADFGDDTQTALVALCAAMTAIVLWAVVAWYFGIPTSESHALIAGITGASVAINKGFSGVSVSEWSKVIYGLILSSVLGFLSGYVTVKIVSNLFLNIRKDKADSFFKGAQIFSGASMAFMHGAQDGQKFIGVFLLGVTLSQGKTQGEFEIPLWLMVLCATVMGIGTSIGGQRIIKSVGMDMVKLQGYQGFSADAAGAFCLLFSTLTGLPVSTTHTKTTAIMGVGAARSKGSVNWSVVKEMAYAWLLTFPGCGIIGFLMSKLFMKIF